MRLKKGIVIDHEKTFGILKFSDLHSEKKEEDEAGNVTEQIVSRSYDLKSNVQGQMLQVILPAEVEVKTFHYNEEVELINPVIGSVASATYNGTDLNWFIKADDIIAKGKPGEQRKMNQQSPQQPKKEGE